MKKLWLISGVWLILEGLFTFFIEKSSFLPSSVMGLIIYILLGIGVIKENKASFWISFVFSIVPFISAMVGKLSGDFIFEPIFFINTITLGLLIALFVEIKKEKAHF